MCFSLTEEQLYVLDELKAELGERIWEAKMIEIETKHSIGQQLVAYPELVPHINNEAHYYVEFAKRYVSPEHAITALDLGKGASWYKIKKHLKTCIEKENTKPNK
jgi:hypothetical protein